MPLKLIKRGQIWHISGSVAGQRIRQSTATANKATAEQIRAKAEQDAWKRHIYGDEAVLTFAHAVIEYLDAGKDHRFVLRLLDYFRETPIRKIKPGHIIEAARLLYPNAGPATRNRQAITPAAAIINYQAEKGRCPPIRVKRFKTPKPKTVAADMEWLEAFRSSARHYQRMLALFMFTTGARVSQAVALTPADIDMSAAKATLPPAKGHPAREVHLIPQMVVDLANSKPRNGRIFGYKTRHSVYGPWKTACKKAGITYIPPHQAGRHSFATELLIRQGWDAVTVAKKGGWASPRVVMETYSHVEAGPTALDQAFIIKKKERG